MNKKLFREGFLVLMLIVGIHTMQAQDYLLNYGPGSPSWCWQQQQQINAMSMQNMMMQQQIVNYYRNQANAVQQQMMMNPTQPISGIVTYDGVYITPENVGNYHTEQVDCEHCQNGYIYRQVYVGYGQSRTEKRRCTYCHGTGSVLRHVPNE